jgi:hypothetical protein
MINSIAATILLKPEAALIESFGISPAKREAALAASRQREMRDLVLGLGWIFFIAYKTELMHRSESHHLQRHRYLTKYFPSPHHRGYEAEIKML